MCASFTVHFFLVLVGRFNTDEKLSTLTGWINWLSAGKKFRRGKTIDHCFKNNWLLFLLFFLLFFRKL